jgi:hypothetical protein
MRRLIRFVRPMAAAGALAIGAVACNSTTNPLTSTTTTTTTANQVTDSFSGTVNLNGSITHQFALGVWNGFGCVVSMNNDNALQGAILAGTAGAAGTYCVRLYDAQGTFTTPVTYTVSVVHP